MAETLTLGWLLFKAVETIVEKIVEAAWEPAYKDTKERLRRWMGKDEESKRRKVFAKAVATAHQQTIKETDEFPEAEKVLKLMDDPAFQDVAVRVADEAVKIMLFSDTPDIDSLTELFSKYLGYRQDIYAETAPTPQIVTRVLSVFFDKLRHALLDEEPYKSLLTQHEILRNLYEQNRTQLDIKKILVQIFNELHPGDYDDEAKYRQQIAVMNRELSFVGIPELKDSSPITIKDIFVRLRASREIDNSLEVIGDSLNNTEKLAVEKLQTRSREEVLLDEAFKEALCMVVLGNPGAGKTTLLKHLTVICAEERAETELGLKAVDGKPLLPIFVSLRLFDAEATTRNQDYSLIDYFSTYSYENLGLKKIPPKFFQTALEAKRCIVCLDRLDEVGSGRNRAKVSEAVIALASRFPGNHYIVTSRIVGYKEAPLNRRDFIHYTISELQDDDIHEFVGKWYAKREPDEVQRKTQINRLITTIQEEPRIQSLARNPLLLTIITLVHRIEAELPNERVKLYDKCVTALVETWEKVKGLTIEEKQRPFYKGRRRLLEQLAYELHTKAEEPGQVQKVKKGSLELLLADFLMQNRNLGLADDRDTALDEAKAFVSLIKGRTGLLIEVGEGVFSFPHLTFQEYLAACDIEKRHIKDKNAIWEKIKEHLHTPHWQEVILLLLGSLNRYDDLSTELVEQILEAGKKDKFEPVLHRHLYLVARAMADRVDVAVDVRRQVVNDLLAVACNKTLFWENDNAFAALSKLEGNDYVSKGLLELAQNEQLDAYVRQQAAESLGKLNHQEQAAEVLLALAQNEQLDAEVRRQAAESLGKLNHQEQAAKVLLALAHDEQLGTFERLLVVQSLGELNHQQQAVEVLLALAQDEQLDADVRLLAVVSLGELNYQQQAVEVLLALAQNEQLNATVRRLAAESLRELNHQEQAAKVLLALAQNEQLDAEVQRQAVESLGKLNHQEQAVEVLLALAQNEQLDATVRRLAAESLGKLNHQEQAVEVLLALAQNEQLDATVRRLAAESLGKLNHQEQAVEVLLALAQNEQLNAIVRRLAAESLRELNHQEQAVEVLLALAQNEQLDADVRRLAAESLGKLNHQEQAVEVLLALAQNEQLDANVRRRAAESLRELNHQEQAVEVLLALAQNEQIDADVRRLAAESLGKLNHQEQAVEVLLALAQNKQLMTYTRRWAVNSLGELNNQEQAAEVLLALAQNEQLDTYTRRWAVLTLRQML